MSKETNIDYAEQTYKQNKVSTFKKIYKDSFHLLHVFWFTQKGGGGNNP